MDTNLEDMKKDILEIVGGNFSPDSVGPDRYAAIVSRVRSQAAEYLNVLESLFLGTNFDAVAHSELYIPAFLMMVADVEPDRVRSVARQLVKQFDSVLVIHDAIKDKQALFQALPPETTLMARRLEQRRTQLKNLMS
ncbi:MAG TPA: hypothetical protein VFQ24_16675 [Terriglobia bacterium]|nr:hypothetical protein [Terriglobia bacterium]